MPPFVKLASGRIIHSTATWNPFVFAFVYDHFIVINYFIKNRNKFNLRKCFSVDSVYSIDKSDHQMDYFEAMQPRQVDESKYLQNFLTLLLENNSKSLAMVVN